MGLPSREARPAARPHSHLSLRRLTRAWLPRPPARPPARPQHAYLRNGWDILDFVVVVASWLALALSGSQASAAKGARLLRALRPLRLIRRWEESLILWVRVRVRVRAGPGAPIRD